MTIDAREFERCSIISHQKGGTFVLHAANRQFRLRNVEDVSVSGTGVRLPTPLKENTPVTLSYTDHDWHVTTQGRVVWSECLKQQLYLSAGTPAYHMGIQFDPNNIEDNKRLFLALRAHLDPFTWAS